MSLINQMLRDLQQHGQRPDTRLPPGLAADPLPPRRRTAARLAKPGLILAGLAGVALLWGLSGWLAEYFAPAEAPAPVQVVATPVPPPPPPPVMAQPVSVPTPTVAAPAAAAVPVRPFAAPAARRVEAAPVADRQAELLPPGDAAPPHPDRLPGAVPSTTPPRFEHPYRQAELAYREAEAAARPEARLTALQRALAAYPGHMPARELLAGQLAEAGRRDQALAVLEEGLRIVPDYTPLRRQGGRLLLEGGDPGGAAKLLIGPGLPRVAADPELHRLLAEAYQQLGEPFLAAQTYRNLLVNDPRAGSLWVGLGTVLAHSGQLDESRQAYRQALAVGGLTRKEAARARAGSGGS